MDLLFKEYASPFVLLDEVISSGRLMEFLDVFEHQRNERTKWEFYIHKLPPWNTDTWEEFNQKLNKDANTNIQTATPEQLEATVSESFSMLQGFNPEA